MKDTTITILAYNHLTRTKDKSSKGKVCDKDKIDER